MKRRKALPFRSSQYTCTSRKCSGHKCRALRGDHTDDDLPKTPRSRQPGAGMEWSSRRHRNAMNRPAADTWLKFGKLGTSVGTGRWRHIGCFICLKRQTKRGRRRSTEESRVGESSRGRHRLIPPPPPPPPPTQNSSVAIVATPPMCEAGCIFIERDGWGYNGSVAGPDTFSAVLNPRSRECWASICMVLQSQCLCTLERTRDRLSGGGCGAARERERRERERERRERERERERLLTYPPSPLPARLD